MPHVYLPDDHTDEDLVLASEIADVLEADELFVAWTSRGGSGRPTVEAMVRPELPAPNPVADLVSAIIVAAVELWRALTTAAPRPAAPGETRVPA